VRLVFAPNRTPRVDLLSSSRIGARVCGWIFPFSSPIVPFLEFNRPKRLNCVSALPAIAPTPYSPLSAPAVPRLDRFFSNLTFPFLRFLFFRLVYGSRKFPGPLHFPLSSSQVAWRLIQFCQSSATYSGEEVKFISLPPFEGFRHGFCPCSPIPFLNFFLLFSGNQHLRRHIHSFGHEIFCAPFSVPFPSLVFPADDFVPRHIFFLVQDSRVAYKF